MVRKSPIAANILISVFLLYAIFLTPLIIANPVSYIIEKVSKSVDYNGTILNDSVEGSIEVDVANTYDVLQNVQIIVSSPNGTNLLNTTAYAAVAASPDPGDRTRLYLTTTDGNSTTKYTFNSTYNVSLRLDYANLAGGKDLVPGNNTLVFTLFLNSSQNLNGLTLKFQASTNTLNQSRDSMNIIESSSSAGGIITTDTNGNGDYDRMVWTGDIINPTNITLTARITPDINYPSDDLSINLDSGRTLLNYSRPSTFSGMTLADRFSRAGVREGVEMTPTRNWTVKGFIKNIGYGTVYRINSWSLYEVGSNTPSNQGSANINLLPGNTYYTSTFNTGISGGNIADQSPLQKPIYYSTYFDWEVMWGSSIYTGLLEENMNMPTLYQIDASIDKRIDLIKNDASGRILEVTDELRHIGHANLVIENVSFNTTFTDAWAISNVVAYKRNGTNISLVNVSSLSSTDGNYVINLTDLSLGQNDVAYIEYTMSRAKEDFNKQYDFGMNVIAVTKSGTPFEKTFYTGILVPGLLKQAEGGGGGGGGGGGMPIVNDTLEIIRKDATDQFISESLLFNNITYRILDTGGKGLRNPVFFIYLPEDSELDNSRLKLILTRHDSKTELKATIKDNGVKAIGSENYKEFVVQMPSLPTEDIALFNNDLITVQYYAELPLGTSTIITRAYGYNYYTDTYFFEDAITIVRRENWMLKNLIFRESSWENRGIKVGVPVKWLKSIEAKNPNEKLVRYLYYAKAFSNMLSSHVKLSNNQTTYDIDSKAENGKIEFLAEVPEKGYQTYFLDAVTAPVLEVKRETQIIEVESDSITFNTLITLHNFADMTYENISFDLSASQALACNCNFSYENNIIRILIPSMKAGEEILINLTSRERPPQVIINTDKLNYSCDENIMATIIVVPNQTKGYMEIELVGPDESMNTLYADIIELGSGPKYTNITIPSMRCATGNYTLYAFYKSNFQTILVSKQDLGIICQDNIEIPWLLFLAIIILVLLVAARKVYKKKSLDSEIDRLPR